MASIEVVLCKRDKSGKKLDGEKLRFRTNNYEWLAGRVERETNRGVPKSKRAAAREKLFTA